MQITDKEGAILRTLRTDCFWCPLICCGTFFDPQVFFDPLSRRWMVTVARGASPTGGIAATIRLAVSQTEDPTGVWTFYTINVDPTITQWADIPRFGVNQNWIVIIGNMFRLSDGAAMGHKMWVIDKSTALSGGPLEMDTFPAGFDNVGGQAQGIVPGVSLAMDASLNQVILVSSSYYDTTTGEALVRLSRVSGSVSSPAWSVVPGSVYTGGGFFKFPASGQFDVNLIDAPQLGSSNTVDTLGSLPFSPIVRAGSV